ncbi:MAG TPA: CAP domain-containing protein [Ktedonobacteraceae bacterium]|nr:CAP domain-containing protein [Ktedonobacteraceae bacterium]
MKKVCWGLICLALIVLLASCGSEVVTTSSLSSYSIASQSLSQSVSQQAPASTSTPMPPVSIPAQRATPVSTPVPHTATPPTTSTPSTPSPSSNCVTYSNEATLVPAKNGTLAAPYGPAPLTGEAQQLAQQLFQLVNADRAACGLPAFAWNATLASGALLHSWNMAHCGFSHTCPDGMTQYQRIANEGFAGASDCGENIGLAGPSTPAWTNVYSVHESMAHEPLGGWHRIHLFSTTLHSIGIGVYIDSNGWVWFSEDMVS